jgi:hypothetical protein
VITTAPQASTPLARRAGDGTPRLSTLAHLRSRADSFLCVSSKHKSVPPNHARLRLKFPLVHVKPLPGAATAGNRKPTHFPARRSHPAAGNTNTRPRPRRVVRGPKLLKRLLRGQAGPVNQYPEAFSGLGLAPCRGKRGARLQLSSSRFLTQARNRRRRTGDVEKRTLDKKSAGAVPQTPLAAPAQTKRRAEAWNGGRCTRWCSW